MSASWIDLDKPSPGVASAAHVCSDAPGDLAVIVIGADRNIWLRAITSAGTQSPDARTW